MSLHQTSDPSATSITPDVTTHSAPAIRLWPAVVIIVAMWLLALVPGWVVPLTLFHFISMQFAPVLGLVLLSIWWLMSKALPLRKRLVGLALAYTVCGLAIGLAHSSLWVVMIVYGLPISLTLLVLALLFTRSSGLPRQAWIGLASFSIVMLGALFFRIGKMNANFEFDLVPRWTPTAEDNLMLARESKPTEPPVELLELSPNATDADWAEFRGPRRDGIIKTVSFESDWKTKPPAELWRQPIGPGWSSFCVVGPVFFTQEQRGAEELVSAYAVADGKPIWTRSNESRFEAAMGGVGPRATPTYRDKQLYTTGASGLVQCLDASTGEPVWQFDLIKELGVPLPGWGFASSPLVLDDTAIVFAGGGDENALVALDRKTGKLAWSSGFGSHGYSSPQLSTIDGVEQVLISTNRGVQSVDPATGKLLWKHDWDIGEMARVTQPTVVDSTVYLGTGYGRGTMCIDVTHEGDTWTTKERWTESMKPYFNDCVHHQGHLYGFDNQMFMCLDAETGERVWKRRGYGHGQVLLVEQMKTLLIITEEGELVLLEATPDKPKELARLESLHNTTWNHPVIGQGKLFVRNAEEMVCYELDVVE
jgi:outer membrane protein assembly factor BamB